MKSNGSDKFGSNPEGEKLTSGEPDALKGASPVRRREWGNGSKDYAPCSYPTEVYDALKEAGASEENASAAAIAVAAYRPDRGNLATKEDVAALKENIAALDKRLAVVEAGLNRVERLLWAMVVGVIVTAIRVWFPIS